MEKLLKLDATVAAPISVYLKFDDTDYQTGGPDIETSWSPIMQRMHRVEQQLNDKFLHPENSLGITELADEYLILAAKLKVLAEVRLQDIARDKIKYAAHPSFPQFPD